MSVSKRWYLRERHQERLCLAYVELHIHAADSEDGCLKVSPKVFERIIKKIDSRLLQKSFTVKKRKQGLQLSFWCQSGTKYFKPTEEPLKNCVEVTIFEFTKVALASVEGKIAKTDIHYMTDLSPCPVCISRLPLQRSTLESNFPNITFLYNDQYILDYEKTYFDKKFNKLLQKPETWIKLKEYCDDIDKGLGIIAGQSSDSSLEKHKIILQNKETQIKLREHYGDINDGPENIAGHGRAVQ